MENKYSPLGYQEMLERIKYKKMLEELSSTTDPEYTQNEEYAYPLERGPTEKFGDLIGRGLYKQPFGFDTERSAMRTGQDLANVASYTPGPGNVLGYLEGEKMAEEGRPFLGNLISAASVGLPKAVNPFTKIATNVATPPPPITKPIKHTITHTADLPKTVRKRGVTSKEFNPSNSPLRYDDPNDTQMMSQISLAESDLFKYPNKEYPLENIFQSMRRYGVTGKGNVNQNVKRQIDDFISPKFLSKGKATPKEVMDELQTNAPQIKETHAYYQDTEFDPAYSRFTTRRPVYDLDNPNTTLSEATEEMSRTYGERSFNMYDDNRIYGKQPVNYADDVKNSFKSEDHSDLAVGKVADRVEPTNKYMHQRYTFEAVDGQDNVLVLQEFQSDAYKLTKDQDKLVTRLNTAGENPASDIPYVLRYRTSSVDEILQGTLTGERNFTEVLGTQNEFRNFQEYLVGTDQSKKFNKEMTEIYKSYSDDVSLAKMNNPRGTEDRRIVLDELEESFYQQNQRTVENYVDGFNEYLGTSANITPKNLPRSEDWFTDNLKLGLQTGAQSDSPFVLIPNGPRSLAKPAGNTNVIPPKMIPFLEKKYKNSTNVKLNYDTKGKLINVQKLNEDYTIRDTVLFAEPDKGSINRAKSYNDFLKKAMKQTEQDYGVKLNATEYIDGYGQEFLKVELTPELKEAFKTFRMNHGGVASLMPLKYDL